MIIHFKSCHLSQSLSKLLQMWRDKRGSSGFRLSYESGLSQALGFSGTVRIRPAEHRTEKDGSSDDLRRLLLYSMNTQVYQIYSYSNISGNVLNQHSADLSSLVGPVPAHMTRSLIWVCIVLHCYFNVSLFITLLYHKEVLLRYTAVCFSLFGEYPHKDVTVFSWLLIHIILSTSFKLRSILYYIIINNLISTIRAKEFITHNLSVNTKTGYFNQHRIKKQVRLLQKGVKFGKSLLDYRLNTLTRVSTYLTESDIGALASL